MTNTSLLSEKALADWNRPEEDKAWAILQARPDKLFTADATIIKDVVGQLTSTIKNKILQSVCGLFT